MKHLALLILICASCQGQDSRPSEACPLEVTVAATNIPFRSGEHIVVWFENQSGKTVSRAQFDLTIIDSTNQRHAAKQEYGMESAVRPSQAGLMIEPASNEARQFNSWKSVRGLDVRIAEVLFSDGTKWQSPGSTACKKTFMNADYQRDMRRWNAALRADWNRHHPEDPMPEPALAAWLLPHTEGWR